MKYKKQPIESVGEEQRYHELNDDGSFTGRIVTPRDENFTYWLEAGGTPEEAD